MNDEGAADVVRNLAADIESKAVDLGLEREHETTLAAEDAKLAAEIEALTARRADLARQREGLRARGLADERDIAKDMRELKGRFDNLGTEGDSEGHGRGGGSVHPGSTEFEFFVDDHRYATDLPHLTGLQIKAKVSNWDATHDLVLEGRGSDPDRIITDDASVDFTTVHGPLHFSSVPKANFG